MSEWGQVDDFHFLRINQLHYVFTSSQGLFTLPWSLSTSQNTFPSLHQTDYRISLYGTRGNIYLTQRKKSKR